MFTIKKDGSITVDTASEAADVLRLLNGTRITAAQVDAELALYDRHKNEEDGPSPMEQAKDLLRAGGFRMIRPVVARCYAAMLAAPSKVWTSATLAKRTKIEPERLNHLLAMLAKRTIIARVGFGQYKVK